MDVFQNEVECNATSNNMESFWPIEHPIEPPDEDQPVKCPIPDHPSLINEEQFSNSPRKRTELPSSVMGNGGMMVLVAGASDPPARAVRKRHHTSSIHGEDHSFTPLWTRLPRHPLPAHNNFTIFPMLQQFNKFDS